MTIDGSSSDSSNIKSGCTTLPKITAENGRPVGASTNDKHLQTDHLLVNLEGRAITSGVVTLISQGAQFFVSMGSVMVLARLLSPADFGLVAMLMTVMGFLRVFKESGLSTATIQREGITHAQVSNLFWINLTVSGAIGLLLAASAPVIAWFYREPRLVSITLILAVTFPLNSLGVQHSALLARQMRFKALALIQLGSQLIGVAVGIGMASAGFRYWALVGMSIATLIANLTMTFISAPWRPQGPSRRSGTRPLVSFGANLAAGGFIFSLAKGCDGLAIGRFFGSDAIGLYSRAGALFNRPMEQLLGAAEAVFVPMLSRIQNQPTRYRSTFLHFYEALALMSCLFTGLLLALSRPITLVILGPKWEEVAIIFAGFSVSALCVPLAAAASWLFASQGRGRGMLLTTSLVSGIVVVAVAIGLPFGPTGVALANSALGLLAGIPVLFYFAGREGPVKTSDLWLGFLRHIPLWAGVCGMAYTAQVLSADYSPITQLVFSTPVGLATGALLIFISPTLRRTAVGMIEIPKAAFLSIRSRGLL